MTPLLKTFLIPAVLTNCPSLLFGLCFFPFVLEIVKH